jgi:hypothetical protein
MTKLNPEGTPQMKPHCWRSTVSTLVTGTLCFALMACGSVKPDDLASQEIGVARSAATLAGSDSIVNGGFEDPVVVHFNVFAGIPGWTSASGCGIEIQHRAAGTPVEGDQLAELGSHDLFGSGCDPRSSMAQDVATLPGATYELRFAYSARPGIGDNRISVAWEGTPLALLSADGRGEADTVWQYFTYEVEASLSPSRLAFADVSVRDTLGGYLDDVSLVLLDPVGGVCPCNGDWKTHGGYVSCVAHATKDLERGGFITHEESVDTRVGAAHSECGRR